MYVLVSHRLRGLANDTHRRDLAHTVLDGIYDDGTSVVPPYPTVRQSDTSAGGVVRCAGG